jgi:hypothetical protein
MSKTTKTLYQQINQYCEMGYYPIVSNSLEYVVISPFKCPHDQWRRSFFEDTLEKAKMYVGEIDGEHEAEWQCLGEKGFKIIGFYHPPIKRFLVGDKVRVRTDLADTQYNLNWVGHPSDYKSTAGHAGTIERVGALTYKVVFNDLNHSFFYSQGQLEPYIEFELESKQETINIDGVDYTLSQIKKALKKST